MASIKKREYLHTFLWQVQIRRKGIPQYTISFPTEEEAIEWVRLNEENYIINPHEYPRLHQRSFDWLRQRRVREFKNDARKQWLKMTKREPSENPL